MRGTLLFLTLMFIACNTAKRKLVKLENTASMESITQESDFSGFTELAKTNKAVAENIAYIQHLQDSLYTEEKLKSVPEADLPPGYAVTIYSDRDFQGASQNLSYIGDLCWREESLTIPRSSFSSIKVPLGLNATLYERWDCQNKLADVSPRDDARLFSEEVNDKVRSIKVLNKSIFYTAVKGDAFGSLFNINRRFKIPTGYTVKWQEATKAGEAFWKAWIANDSFYIQIKVRGPGTFSGRSWCGVDAWLVKQ